MSDDAEYLANYTPDKLYVHPGPNGAYATICGASEEVIGGIDITQRCKLAVKAFWVNDKSDFGTFALIKLTHHKTYGWREDSRVQITHFQLAQIRDFLRIIASLDFGDARKTKVSLENVSLAALTSLLTSNKAADVIAQLAESPELHQDIYALAAKRSVLDDFEHRMGKGLSEADWQAFFEVNSWIFGHGLHYVAMGKVSETLMAKTTGHEFDRAGKTVDALMRTRAQVSQFVFVEIKRDSTALLRQTAEPYRPGCYGVSSEVSNAVTQVQKTTFDFARRRFREVMKDAAGNDTTDLSYSVEPRGFLVVGNSGELSGNDDKIACFELYRRNVRSPEILTFDELLYRARFIVQNLSGQAD
jgi:hypothetical protein